MVQVRLFSRKADARPEPQRQNEPNVEILAVERCRTRSHDSRVMESAIVTYVAGGQAGSLTASITWETLALLRKAAIRAGIAVDEDELVENVLAESAREQLEASLSRGEPLPASSLLDLAALGPASTRPAELMSHVLGRS